MIPMRGRVIDYLENKFTNFPSGGDVAGETHAATAKTTPTGADEMPLVDSAASFVIKRLTLTNLAAWLFTTPKFGFLYDSNANKSLVFVPTASAVNYIGAYNSVTTAGPILSAEGTDTNIDLKLFPKGTGAVKAWNGSGYDTIATLVAAQTLTGKRVQPRVVSPAVAGTYTIDVTVTDLYVIGTQNAAITNLTTTGTLVDGEKVFVRIKGDSTPRAITWDTAKFASSGVATLLATTAASKTHLSAFVYDATLGKLVLMAVDATGY